MFIETSAKAGYNVKQVCRTNSIFRHDPPNLFRIILFHSSFFPQLFRRVAAALPGMEADKKPPEDSKNFFFYSRALLVFLFLRPFSFRCP